MYCFGHLLGFFAEQCVVFTKKKTPKQTLFKNHCVGGGSGGRNGEGGWGLTSKDQKTTLL